MPPGGSSAQGEQHASEVRQLYARFLKGKRQQAIRQLEQLAAAHPSGLACQALAKAAVLEAVEAAVKVRPASNCVASKL